MNDLAFTCRHDWRVHFIKLTWTLYKQGRLKMQFKTKLYATMAMFFLAISTIFAVLPMTGGAGTGTVTLTPSNAAPGGTVTVAGTGFASTQAIGIGIGNEVAVANESHPIANPTGTGPFNAVCAYKPVKVGSFYFHCVVSSDTNVVESNYWDAGDGTMTSDSTYALTPYATTQQAHAAAQPHQHGMATQ
jgi:hypothetical protein